MAQARVEVLKEVKKEFKDENNLTDFWTLCFQYCRYEYGDENNTKDYGYRFIWRRPKTGNLQGARGQARIPSTAIILELVSMAINEGWGHYLDEQSGFEIE